MSVKDRKVLLTGGLGSLGQAQARLLHAHGAQVYLLDLPSEHGQAFAESLQDCAPADVRVQFVACDLSRLEQSQAQVSALSERVGGFDILINNAALITHKPFEEFSLQEYEEILRVNSSAAFALVQALAPSMKTKGYGRIINFCSLTLNGRWEKYVPYVASKGALYGLTKTLARALGPYGITVNAISPGAIISAAEARVFGDAAQEYNDWILENQSVKRRGQPEDVAELVLFLAGERTSFLSGQNIQLDGGW